MDRALKPPSEHDLFWHREGDASRSERAHLILNYVAICEKRNEILPNRGFHSTLTDLVGD